MPKKTKSRLTKKEVRNKLLVLFEQSQGQQRCAQNRGGQIPQKITAYKEGKGIP